MSDITLTDVTFHIDSEMDSGTRTRLEDGLRKLRGVISVHMPSDKPHLVVVEYEPELTNSTHLLAMVRELAGKAEMIGL